MARMINADDLYEAMNQVGAFEVLKDKRKELFTSAWGVPIVEAKPVKHGRWIVDVKRYGNENPHCSECSAVLEGDQWYWRNNNYCYHCGAKMDEKE